MSAASPRRATHRGGAGKALAILREEGLVAGTRSVVGKLAGRVYRTERAFVLRKRLDDVRPVARADGLEVREATPEEALAFAGRVGFRRKVESYLARGDRCFLAFHAGEPIGMVWWLDGADAASRGHAQAERFGIRLGPDEVYSYDLWVVPEKRGDGTGTSFFALFEEALRKRGYTANYGWVDEQNQPARWLYRLRRYETVRPVTSRVVLRWLRFTEGRAYVGPERAYRRVRLGAASR